ncbi:hypothetical protein BUALT_Bualt11G0074000 [Buddleja alternifolia]|uniref:Uncharacterized protein n=1 Tax=Buddleja alternifolia TaxID=168488 RepID=A0AAV6X0H7_9LAMI|nr:hypothetical protein BUALT_Bualt11G0074000 [Buddleja alternifolia]
MEFRRRTRLILGDLAARKIPWSGGYGVPAGTLSISLILLHLTHSRELISRRSSYVAIQSSPFVFTRSGFSGTFQGHLALGKAKQRYFSAGDHLDLGNGAGWEFLQAEPRASVFEAIEEEDRVVEDEEGLPPALLGSCNDRAKQLHNSLSVYRRILYRPGFINGAPEPVRKRRLKDCIVVHKLQGAILDDNDAAERIVSPYYAKLITIAA